MQLRKEKPPHTITLPPAHLSASRTQQFAYHSLRRRHVRIRPSLPLKWKRDLSLNRTSAHWPCNHRWLRWVHCSRSCPVSPLIEADVALLTHTQRLSYWMRRLWFDDITLALPGRGLSLKAPVSAVLWTSLVIVEGDNPSVWQFDAQTVLQLTYPLLHVADCYYSASLSIYQDFFKRI